MSWLALIAQAAAEPPKDLALYVGGLVIAAFVGNQIKRGPQADADFRAQVLTQLQNLAGEMGKLSTTHARQDERIGHHAGRLDHLEKRQDEQAKSHKADIAEIRERIERMEALRRGD